MNNEDTYENNKNYKDTSISFTRISEPRTDAANNVGISKEISSLTARMTCPTIDAIINLGI